MLRVATMGSVAAAPPEWNRIVVLLDRGPAVGWACLAIRMALDRAESLLEPALRLPYRTELSPSFTAVAVAKRSMAEPSSVTAARSRSRPSHRSFGAATAASFRPLISASTRGRYAVQVAFRTATSGVLSVVGRSSCANHVDYATRPAKWASQLPLARRTRTDATMITTATTTTSRPSSHDTQLELAAVNGVGTGADVEVGSAGGMLGGDALLETARGSAGTRAGSGSGGARPRKSERAASEVGSAASGRVGSVISDRGSGWGSLRQ